MKVEALTDNIEHTSKQILVDLRMIVVNLKQHRIEHIRTYCDFNTFKAHERIGILHYYRDDVRIKNPKHAKWKDMWEGFTDLLLPYKWQYTAPDEWVEDPNLVRRQQRERFRQEWIEFKRIVNGTSKYGANIGRYYASAFNQDSILQYAVSTINEGQQYIEFVSNFADKVTIFSQDEAVITVEDFELDNLEQAVKFVSKYSNYLERPRNTAAVWTLTLGS